MPIRPDALHGAVGVVIRQPAAVQVSCCMQIYMKAVDLQPDGSMPYMRICADLCDALAKRLPRLEYPQPFCNNRSQLAEPKPLTLHSALADQFAEDFEAHELAKPNIWRPVPTQVSFSAYQHCNCILKECLSI